MSCKLIVADDANDDWKWLHTAIWLYVPAWWPPGPGPGPGAAVQSLEQMNNKLLWRSDRDTQHAASTRRTHCIVIRPCDRIWIIKIINNARLHFMLGQTHTFKQSCREIKRWNCCVEEIKLNCTIFWNFDKSKTDLSRRKKYRKFSEYFFCCLLFYKNGEA